MVTCQGGEDECLTRGSHSVACDSKGGKNSHTHRGSTDLRKKRPGWNVEENQKEGNGELLGPTIRRTFSSYRTMRQAFSSGCLTPYSFYLPTPITTNPPHKHLPITSPTPTLYSWHTYPPRDQASTGGTRQKFTILPTPHSHHGHRAGYSLHLLHRLRAQAAAQAIQIDYHHHGRDYAPLHDSTGGGLTTHTHTHFYGLVLRISAENPKTIMLHYNIGKFSKVVAGTGLLFSAILKKTSKYNEYRYIEWISCPPS